MEMSTIAGLIKRTREYYSNCVLQDILTLAQECGGVDHRILEEVRKG